MKILKQIEEFGKKFFLKKFKTNLKKIRIFQWKTFLHEHGSKKSIEVKSDKRTEELRANGRNMLKKAFDKATLDALEDPEEIETTKNYNTNLAEQIEREGEEMTIFIN